MNHDLLSNEMANEHKRWALSTKVYGTLYPAIRFFLIAASALVAAKESMATFKVLATWLPLLAVLVTIVTALDTWLKPRDKWRGFMKDRDDLSALRLRAESLVSSQDVSAVERLLNDFAELRRRHRDENVW